MDTELIKVVQQAVRDGPTSASWIVILISLISAGLGAFLGSYLKRKGEHLATRDDFDELLLQIKAQTKVTEEIKQELSGKLWIAQKQWELKREIYKSVLEVIDETRSAMKKVDYKWGPVPFGASPDEAARLQENRQDSVEDARVRISRATRKLHHTAVFSQVVLSEEAIQTLMNLLDMLEEEGDADLDDYLPAWIRETDQVYRTLIDEARHELGAMPIKGH